MMAQEVLTLLLFKFAQEVPIASSKNIWIKNHLNHNVNSDFSCYKSALKWFNILHM